MHAFAHDQLPRAVAIWGAAGAVAGALGPTLGAAIVEGLGWRWAFFVNLPVGVYTVIAGCRNLRESSDPGTQVPSPVNPWWAVLSFYLVCSWLVGFFLALTFQLAHCVDITTMNDHNAPRRGNDFTVHQLSTTADIAAPMPIIGHLFRFMFGSLDHQIEHHLAPRLPHTIYPLVAERFRQACHDHHIAYHLHPGVWSALRSHTRWLHTMSTPASHAR